MIQYIYFVKCPNCEDEPFDFFSEAKDYALRHLSEKPIITQIEVDRNDFGECVDSSDLGTIWSWEDMMEEPGTEPAASLFTKADLVDFDPGCDREFAALDNSIDSKLDDIPDNFRKPVSEGINRELKTWICFYDGNDVGTVKAYDENEAMSNFEDEYSGEYSFDSWDHDWSVEATPEGYIEESCKRKPIPEDMTIEQLVEEMEENEDMIECKWCEELFSKEDGRFEVGFGGLICPSCQNAAYSRGERMTYKTNDYWDFLDETTDKLTESTLGNEEVEFEYYNLKVTLQGPKRDVDDWDEKELVVDYTYTKDLDDVAYDIWNHFISEEDVKDVPGGLEALVDEPAWTKFLETHWDTLFEKYYKDLLEYYRNDAIDEYESTHGLDESISKPFLEELEDRETYRKRLNLCPECGEQTFDYETGMCINCGFNTLRD